MFLKLLKNQFSLTYKPFIVLFVINILSILLAKLFAVSFFTGLFVYIWTISSFIILFYYFYVLIKICSIFEKRRSYFLFSLPIEPHKILGSALLISFIYFILSFLCIGFSVYILIHFEEPIIKIFSLNPALIPVILLKLTNISLIVITLIALILFCMIFSQTSLFKNKVFVVLLFVLIVIFYSIIVNPVLYIVTASPYLCYNSVDNTYAIKLYSVLDVKENIMPVFNVILFSIHLILFPSLYFSTIYFMKNKLEI